jgi:hypothetical protein
VKLLRSSTRECPRLQCGQGPCRCRGSLVK